MPNPYAALESNQKKVARRADSVADIKNLPDLFCDTLQSTPVPKNDLLVAARNDTDNLQSTKRVVLTEENPYSGLASLSQRPMNTHRDDSAYEYNKLPVEFPPSTPNPYRSITQDPSQRVVNAKQRYGDSIYEIYKLPRQFYSANPYSSDTDNSESTDQSVGDETIYENQKLPNPFKNHKGEKKQRDGAEDTDEDIRRVPSLPRLSSKGRIKKDKSNTYLPASAYAPENRRNYQAFDPRNNGYSSSDSVCFGSQSISSRGNPYRRLRKRRPLYDDYRPVSRDSDGETLVDVQNVPDYFDTSNAYAIAERDETQRVINPKLRSSNSQYEIDALPDVFPPRRRRGASVSSKYSDAELTYNELNNLPDLFEDKPRYVCSNSSYFAPPLSGVGYLQGVCPQAPVAPPEKVYYPNSRLGYQPKYNYQYRPAFSDSSVAEINALPDVFDMCRIQADAAMAAARAAQHAANVARGVYQASQLSRRAKTPPPTENPYRHPRSLNASRSDIEEILRLPDPFNSNNGYRH
ncbi:unnamed protein product [Bursaphelenchus xylophilus]|uniref:(pine wood nematode) hypothetical protein n=1 Tax=Bursaphelenchus xylophilus TaxID=6326 RepID=A0A1I7RJ66_BURXY|nr:unnamed protein product [Bursaphelenchus xylophilus]CAG9119406.1 unnamed protein product [Bursaphelenchus xylophilus]